MFNRKQARQTALQIELPQPVWFLLVEVEVTGNSIQPWIAGSKALVQAFVPSRQIENALSALDAFLPTQELARRDVLKATRHSSEDEWDTLPENYYREPLERAARSNECCLGVFVVSRETAWPHNEIQQ